MTEPMTANHADTGPYSDVTVIDLSQGFAGPYASALLAAQGATVVKVEPPNGDWSRHIGARQGDNTAFGTVANLGKRSIRVDATVSQGREVIGRLVDGADVVVQNYRPDVATRLGLDAASLRSADPRLVTVRITGFGASSSAADLPATDMILQGWTGLARLGRASDEAARPLAFTVVDVAAGVYTAQRIGSALYAQARHGRGCEVEVSLLQAALALQGPPLLDQAFIDADGREGEGQRRLAAPSGVFAAADGELMLSCINDRMFDTICDALDLHEHLDITRLGSASERLAHAHDIDTAIARILAQRPAQEWIDRLAPQGILCGPVHSYRDVLASPVVREANVLTELRAAAGPVPVVALPGSSPDAGPVQAPGSGEHSEPILRELGYADTEVAALIADRAVLPERPLSATGGAPSGSER